MSACRECIAASLARAGVIDSLEQQQIPPARARTLLKTTELKTTDLKTTDTEPAGQGCSQVERCLERADAAAIWTICRHSYEYPAGLLRFECESDIPHAIYGIGQRQSLSELIASPGVSIVGARRATAYGREVAYDLARECAEAKLPVVSGMALGIDGAAHRGALQGGGSTIAVLAGGVERAYPRSHRLLYEQIIEHGCVISESPPGFEARRWSFVARNRIIAALAKLTVFVEGTQGSGARHTVEFAEQLDLLVGAVPGPITSQLSAGPNALLGEPGVVAIRGIDDLLAAVGVERFPEMELSSDDARADDRCENTVLAAVLAGARDPRALDRALPELDAREISRQLGELELGGKLRRLANGEYEVRSRGG